MVRKLRWMFVLILFAALIKLFSFFPLAVEHYYSRGIYPYIAMIQRIALGWIPFSVGDLLYFISGIWLIAQLVVIIKKISKKAAGGKYFLLVASRLVSGCLVVYVVFNILWGLNYNRIGIRTQMNLSEDGQYSDSELVALTRLLALKLNTLQPASLHQRQQLGTNKFLFGDAVRAYHSVGPSFGLHYKFPSVKSSFYGYLGNYLGFTGYYNPFSGEAQVNTTVPLFVRPFTTCHEIGHQLGYAKESEANFAGYLSASSSADTSFLYSVYFDMYLYAARYLYYSDSSALKDIKNGFSPGVKNDMKELSQFLDKYSTPVEAIIDRLYSRYLRANEQPSGRMSYNEVVSMLIAYQRRYGRI